MDIFGEQIRQRKQMDQELFEDSVLRMASAVIGGRDASVMAANRLQTKKAVDDVLKFYGINPVDIPASMEDPDEQLEYALRPHGIMHCAVALDEGWYKDAFGPMIAYRKNDGCPMALLPKPGRGYWFYDQNGNKTTVNKSNASKFERKAHCFYRPLPLEKLKTADLITYMRQCLDVSDVAFLAGISLVAVAIGLLLPTLSKVLTGFVANTGSHLLLWTTAAFLFCVIIARHLMTAAREVSVNRIRTKVSVPVCAAFMMRTLSLPAQFFKQHSSGELAGRVSAVSSLVELLVSNVLGLGITALFSLVYIGQIAQFTPALALPAVLVIVAQIALSLAVSVMQTKINQIHMEYSVKEAAKSFSMVYGIQKIKLAGAEKRAFAQWARAYTKSAETQYNPPMFLKIGPALISGVTMAGAIVLYYLAVVNNVTPSDYVAFFTAYGLVMGAFMAISNVVQSLSQITPLLTLISPLLEAVPEVSENKEVLTNLSGRIELEGVSFRYDENTPYIIDNMDLTIKRGEYVAIVGKSGCGKTTLVRLLLGFEDPDRGAVRYDGKDITKVDLRSLRRRIGAVTQDGFLFAEDILSNILISAPELGEDAAWEAAELAGIADDIRELPLGMNTMIAEGGGGLSGGQKQRLMIARAIAPKPNVLIFDEATSALDNLTQRKVSDALDSLKCTRIVIAHRLSTIRNCDRILYMENGKIVEEGTYDELIAQQGLFAELVERQRLDS